jgi:hypothetical protein
MYNTIKTYIGTLFTAVNAGNGTSQDFAEVTIGWDFKDMPNNQCDKYYKIKIDGFDEDSEEMPGHCTVSVDVEQFYLLANDTGNYDTIIDSYVRAFYKQLRAFHGYKSTASKFAITELTGIKVSGLKNIIDSNWLNPTFTLTFKCIDSL